MALILKPDEMILSRIFPVLPAAVASGLIIVNVLLLIFIIFLSRKDSCFQFMVFRYPVQNFIAGRVEVKRKAV